MFGLRFVGKGFALSGGLYQQHAGGNQFVAYAVYRWEFGEGLWGRCGAELSVQMFYRVEFEYALDE